MTNKELHEQVITIAISREKKNQYTQGEKRTQVGLGWSDCSSFVRWCYLQTLDLDIGGNTAAQITNKKLIVVDTSGGKCFYVRFSHANGELWREVDFV